MFRLEKTRTMTVPAVTVPARTVSPWGGPVVLLALLMLAETGCTPTPPKPAPDNETTAVVDPTKPENDPDEAPREQVVVNLAPPKDTKPTGIPEVKLSETVKATCKVGVGDAFPRLEGFPEKWGEKATVVAFFTTGTKPMSKMKAKELLDDLQKVAAVHPEGLSVIAVDVAEKQETDDAQTSYTLIDDESSELFGAVAIDATPPRLFLLDPEGRVLWMDTEYSQATRGQLQQSLDFLLGSANGT